MRTLHALKCGPMQERGVNLRFRQVLATSTRRQTSLKNPLHGVFLPLDII